MNGEERSQSGAGDAVDTYREPTDSDRQHEVMRGMAPNPYQLSQLVRVAKQKPQAHELTNSLRYSAHWSRKRLERSDDEGVCKVTTGRSPEKRD
jgi:hypothetical protein